MSIIENQLDKAVEEIRKLEMENKEVQAEKPNIKVITTDDLLQHMLQKVNKELESEE